MIVMIRTDWSTPHECGIKFQERNGRVNRLVPIRLYPKPTQSPGFNRLSSWCVFFWLHLSCCLVKFKGRVRIDTTLLLGFQAFPTQVRPSSSKSVVVCSACCICRAGQALWNNFHCLGCALTAVQTLVNKSLFCLRLVVHKHRDMLH
jgi:hypothetical protein